MTTGVSTYEILAWHGIPTGVRATDEEGQVVEHLPPRFQVAVDALSMKTGLTEYEEYLAGWEYSDPVERQGSAEEVAKAVAEEIVASYTPKRVKEISRKAQARLMGEQS